MTKTDTLGGPLRSVRRCRGDLMLRAWIAQTLAPNLQPGDIVIMDDLPGHEVQSLRQAVLN